MPLHPRRARHKNSPALLPCSHSASPAPCLEELLSFPAPGRAIRASWWAQRGAGCRRSCASGVRRIPVPLLPAPPPAGSGHPWGAAGVPAVPAWEDSGTWAGSQPGQGCGAQWGCGTSSPCPVPLLALSVSSQRLLSAVLALRCPLFYPCAYRSCFGLNPAPSLLPGRADGCGAGLWLGVGPQGGCDPTGFQGPLLCDFGLPGGLLCIPSSPNGRLRF